MCKDTELSVTKSESEFSKAMRSVVVKTPIRKGETFDLKNITTKRPFLAGNIHALKYFDLIGKTAKQDYETDDFLLEYEL